MNKLRNLREEMARASADIAYQKSMGAAKFADKIPANMYLYFIGCGDAVKIGRSKDPSARLDSLATGAPGKLRLIAKVPNAGHREGYCHKALAEFRIHGEWYRHTSEVDALIKEMSA